MSIVELLALVDQIPVWHIWLSVASMLLVSLMSYLLVKPLGYVTVSDIIWFVTVMFMCWMLLVNVYIIIAVLLYLIVFHAKPFLSTKIIKWKD